MKELVSIAGNAILGGGTASQIAAIYSTIPQLSAVDHLTDYLWKTPAYDFQSAIAANIAQVKERRKKICNGFSREVNTYFLQAAPVAAGGVAIDKGQNIFDLPELSDTKESINDVQSSLQDLLGPLQEGFIESTKKSFSNWFQSVKDASHKERAKRIFKWGGMKLVGITGLKDLFDIGEGFYKLATGSKEWKKAKALTVLSSKRLLVYGNILADYLRAMSAKEGSRLENYKIPYNSENIRSEEEQSIADVIRSYRLIAAQVEVGGREWERNNADVIASITHKKPELKRSGAVRELKAEKDVVAYVDAQIDAAFSEKSVPAGKHDKIAEFEHLVEVGALLKAEAAEIRGATTAPVSPVAEGTTVPVDAVRPPLPLRRQ
jgi:hypothetical protein